jgi:hypothetical protein
LARSQEREDCGLEEDRTVVLADRRTGALRGRDETLDQLGVALLQASSGHATVMLVEGQPGPGKTALCAHVVTTASDRLFRVVLLAPVEGEFDLHWPVSLPYSVPCSSTAAVYLLPSSELCAL